MKENVKYSQNRKARPTCGKEQKIPDHIVELASNVHKRVDYNFGALLAKNDMRNVDMLNELYPIIRNEQHMSKLVSGEQHVSLEILVVLRYVFGVDLNEFIASDGLRQPSLPADIQKAINTLSCYKSTDENGK